MKVSRTSVRDEYHTYIISHQKFVLGQKIFIYDIIYAGLEIALSKTYSNLVLKTIMLFEIEDMIKDFENGTRLSNINVH